MPVYDDQEIKKEQGSHDNLGVSAEDRKAEIADLENNYNTPSANEPDYGDTPSREDLDEGEKSPQDDEFNYNDGDKGSGVIRVGNALWGTKRRRRGLIGGVVGLLTLGGGFGFFSIASGPLEFMQVSQILHQTHFAPQENASNGRLSRMMRYSTTGERGETRLGYLSSQYHSRIVNKLKVAGVTMEYKGAGGKLSRVTIDTNNKASQFYGMSEDDLRQRGLTPNSFRNGVGEFTPNSWLEERSAQRMALSAIKGNMAITAVRNRIFGHFGMADFHVLTALNRTKFSTAAKISDHFKEKWKGIINGTSGQSVTVTANAQPDKDGKVSTEASQQASATQQAAQQALDNAGEVAEEVEHIGSVGNSLGRFGQGLLGPVSAGQAIVCPFVAVNQNVKNLRYAMVILPLIRAGMAAIVVGNQIKTGQDVDMAELQYLSKHFNQLDTDGLVTDKAGSVLNNWYDAKSIRTSQGLSGGVDALDYNGTKAMLHGDGSVPQLKWTNNFELGCSTTAQIAGGVASIGITILTLGTGSAAGQGVSQGAKAAIKGFVSRLAQGGTKATIKRVAKEVGKQAAFYYGTKAGIDLLTNLLKGEAIEIASGAEWGEDIDYGAALAANASNLALGGTKLTSQQVAALQTDVNQQQASSFSQRSVFARIFDMRDYRSLISRVASNFTPSFLQNISSMAHYLTNIGSTIFNSISSILSRAHADGTPQPYDYGFPIYGFSKEDLNNSSIQDPLANADYVGSKLLSTCINEDGSIDTGCKYISEAKKCFSVDITQTSGGGSSQKLWDVVPADQGARGDFDPYNSTTYNPDECANPPKINSSDWLKLRFFIFDTGSMEGYACGAFQDTISCANSGVSS